MHRKRIKGSLWGLLGVCLCLSCTPKEKAITSYVDPFIGTDETDFISLWRSEAGLYPGAVAPHGMLQLTPETKHAREYLRGYFYKEDSIRRFSMTEHFSGWPNGSAGKGMFMPYSRSTDTPDASSLASAFLHEEEQAEPGYYQVRLADAGIELELAAMGRSGMTKVEFEQAQQNGLAFWGFQRFEQVGENAFEASLRAGRSEFQKTDIQIHLYLVFKEPVTFKIKGEGRKGQWFISPQQQTGLTLKLGISYTSAKNAKQNLETEIPDWELSQVRTKAKALWEEELSIIELEGEEADKTTFYTALYHASLLPVNVTDINGQYPGFERGGPLALGETHYHYFTPWDAFRTLHPLVNFINPEKGEAYLRSALRYYRIYGKLPEPTVMTSVSMSALFADALAQGIPFDTALAYQGLKELILAPPYFRGEAMESYDALGYVPFPMDYATTATLEFAFNDWALAKIAAALGEQDVVDKLNQRALNYQTQLEPNTRFMRSKTIEGAWAPASIYAEADKWTSSWFVPHDVQGLINLMGGNQAFCELLTQNFEEGHYILDNECPMNFHALFSYAGRSDLTMKWTRKLLRQYFKNKPYGVPGNDDWGTMSSWFMFNAMGLFPAAPGTDEFILTSPLFERVTIHRSENEKIVLEAENVSDATPYVHALSLAGKKYQNVFVRGQDLINQNLVFEMGAEPQLAFFDEGEKPYSLTEAKPEFQVKSFALSRKLIDSNEAFTAQVDVFNPGATGNYLLEIKDKDSAIVSEYFLIHTGETQKLSAEIKLFEGGVHRLVVEDLSEEVKVSPTTLEVERALVIEPATLEPLVEKGDSLLWSCQYQNISGNLLKYEPTLYVDEQEILRLGEREVRAGEIQHLKGKIATTQLSNGFHILRIGHAPAASFKVYEQAKETLVLHYTFDEKGTEIMDYSGFDNHGEMHGQVKWVEGVSGLGLDLSEGYIAVPTSHSTEIQGEGMTVLCWYKPSKYQKGAAALMTKGTFHMMKIQGRWQIKFAAGSWGRGQCFYNSKPKPGQGGVPAWQEEWTHFGGVKSADAISVFVNGEQKNQLPHPGALQGSEFEWRIGSNQVHEHRIPYGVVDEVMIFSGTLSEAEIREIVQGQERK